MSNSMSSQLLQPIFPGSSHSLVEPSVIELWGELDLHRLELLRGHFVEQFGKDEFSQHHTEFLDTTPATDEEIYRKLNRRDFVGAIRSVLETDRYDVTSARAFDVMTTPSTTTGHDSKLAQTERLRAPPLNKRRTLSDDHQPASSPASLEWTQLVDYLVCQLAALDTNKTTNNKNLSSPPFCSDPKYKLLTHNKRGVTARVIPRSRGRLLVVSRSGALSLLDHRYRCLHHHRLLIDDSPSSTMESWVVDAATMDEETVVVATSDSSLHILHSTEESQHPLLALTQLPAMPSCLCIRPSLEGHYIVVGDESGVVHVINLVSVSALTASAAAGQPLTELPWQELCAQVKVNRLSGGHSRAVASVDLNVSSANVVSCSQDPKVSVLLQGLDQASPGYCFSVHKGVCTFALDWGLHVLATGSRDGSVKLWNPYVPAAPLAGFSDHKANIIDILISTSCNAVLALAADKVLRVWNVDTYKCLQTIEFDFPSPSSKKTSNDANATTDLGPRPLTLLSSGTLLVTCRDYLASLGPSSNSDELPPTRLTNTDTAITANAERPLSSNGEDIIGAGSTTASFIDLKNESITTDAKERERMKDLIDQGSPFCCLKLFKVPPLNFSKDLPSDINIKGSFSDLLRSHAAASRALSRSLSSATFPAGKDARFRKGRSSRTFLRATSRSRANQNRGKEDLQKATREDSQNRLSSPEWQVKDK